jgi:ABC-type sugar transport system ATPase subunit
MGVCDRILVMQRGQIVGALGRSEYNQERIMNLALGGRGS